MDEKPMLVISIGYVLALLGMAPDTHALVTIIGLVGVALTFLLLVHRRDMLRILREWRQDSQVLNEIVEENTRAIRDLTEYLRWHWNAADDGSRRRSTDHT